MFTDSSDSELEDTGEKSASDDEWDEDIESGIENMDQGGEDNDESDADDGEEMET